METLKVDRGMSKPICATDNSNDFGYTNTIEAGVEDLMDLIQESLS